MSGGEHDVLSMHVGTCEACGSTDAPTRVVTRYNGSRVTLCRDPFACWERESTHPTPPADPGGQG